MQPVRPRAGSDHLPMETHSQHEPLRSPAQKGLEESFCSIQQTLNQILKGIWRGKNLERGKNYPPKTSFMDPEFDSCLCPWMFPSHPRSQAAEWAEISDSHLYWRPHTCSFHHRVPVSQNHNIVGGKSGFDYFLFEIICVSKMGFAQPVPVPQQRTELIFLSQKGCIQACMAL